ncbi:MAG: Gfo/Idh/MocA family oxidoreductase [Zavarzinella sp.]
MGNDFKQFAVAGSMLAGAAALDAMQKNNDELRIGLIGCGGRGTGAASQALKADSNVRLTAMGDAFEDRLQSSLKTLKNYEALAAKIDVPAERQFVGLDAYQKVLQHSDVVLLCTPPGFRPQHLKAAIDAGKHVFAEKPVAVDGPGIRSVLESCKKAQEKNLGVLSGLCLRFHYGFQEIIKRVHDGAIGDLKVLQANDLRTGRWARTRQPEWTDLQYQMRNWYNFTWLSGDFNVEQHVHFLDVCAWLMNGQYPTAATGVGGRQVLTGKEHGNIYDHFSIVYEYADGAKMFSNTRQQPGCKNELSASAIGTKGMAFLSERTDGIYLTNPERWVYQGKENNIYQTEHDEFFMSIRAGKPFNNGEYMAKSTLLAIMGRMAAYTGQRITWEMALNSKESLVPDQLDWKMKLPDPPIAIPGITKFQ